LGIFKCFCRSRKCRTWNAGPINIIQLFSCVQKILRQIITGICSIYRLNQYKIRKENRISNLSISRNSNYIKNKNRNTKKNTPIHPSQGGAAISKTKNKKEKGSIHSSKEQVYQK
jgi:hypothetical protein